MLERLLYFFGVLDQLVFWGFRLLWLLDWIFGVFQVFFFVRVVFIVFGKSVLNFSNFYSLVCGLGSFCVCFFSFVDSYVFSIYRWLSIWKWIRWLLSVWLVEELRLGGVSMFSRFFRFLRGMLYLEFLDGSLGFSGWSVSFFFSFFIIRELVSYWGIQRVRRGSLSRREGGIVGFDGKFGIYFRNVLEGFCVVRFYFFYGVG